MTVRFFLPSLLVFLFGCTDESQHNVSATVVDAVAHGNNITADASSTSAVNLKDIFLLLPDDVFPLEAISTAKRKQLLKHIGEDSAFDISPTPIDIYDVKNGYLNLTGMQFGWEMSYWNLQDGRKLVAINNGTESGSEIRVFFYQKGMLTEDPNYQLGGQQNYNLSDFIDIAQLSPENRKFALQQFTKGAYHLYYQLPQKGTSLKVSLDADRLLGSYSHLWCMRGKEGGVSC